MFIAFRLKPGRDDDLIEWINTLGQDERSYHIRQALRGNIAPIRVPIKIKPKEVEHKPQADNTKTLEENLESWI